MRVVVINGTQVKGCTYHIKEIFLEQLGKNHEIQEFYLPKDGPAFCTGCKTCFLKSETQCPHARTTMPIWEAIMQADLLVFAYPVYALRAPAQLKALLDHFCCHWMVHRPKEELRKKRAAVITQSIGAPNGAAQKDVTTSLTWLGVSDVKTLGFGLMEGIVWSELSGKRQKRITDKTKKLAQSYQKTKEIRQSLKVRLFFIASKMMHKGVLKTEEIPSADNQYWIEKGWIKR